MDDEAMQAMVLPLALHLASGGQQGEAPPWWGTMQAARYLGLPPWELDPGSRAKREHWRERALIALRAEAIAQQMRAQALAAQQAKQARGGLLVPA